MKKDKVDSCGFPIRSRQEKIVTAAVAIIGGILWLVICFLMLSAGSRSL